MPRMDGYTVIAELKKCDELEGIPIIAIIHYTMEGDREQILADGVIGYNEKPFDPETFVDEIIQYLPKEREEKEK